MACAMIPVCLYFQVHQPWRLRRYNYFDVGREHRYFDEAANRDLLRRRVRALVPAGDRDARPAPRAPPSLRRLLLDLGLPAGATRPLGAGCARRVPPAGGDRGRAGRVPRRDLAPLPRVARLPGGVRRAGRLASARRGRSLRPDSDGLPQHRAHLLRRARRVPRGAGLPGRARRRRRAADRPALTAARLPRFDAEGPAAAPAGLPAVRRHRVPLLQPLVGRVAADGREVRPLDFAVRGRSAVALHGLRDLRRAPAEGDRNLRVLRGLGRPARREARRGIPDAVAGDRDAAPPRPALGAADDLVGRRSPRSLGLAGQRPAAGRPEAALRARGTRPGGGLARAAVRLPSPHDVRSFLLHGHQVLGRRRGPRVFLAVRLSLRGVHRSDARAVGPRAPASAPAPPRRAPGRTGRAAAPPVPRA